MDEEKNQTEPQEFTGESISEITRPLPFAKDEAYLKLLREYQSGNWVRCLDLLDGLLLHYPGDEELNRFRQDVLGKISLQEITSRFENQERREKTVRTITRWAIITIVVMIIASGVLWGYSRFRDSIFAQNSQREQEIIDQALSRKYANAESFLSAGRAEDALDILEEIAETNPDYEDVQVLITRAEELIRIEELYQEGVTYFEEGDLETALDVFTRIDDASPRYKDVRSRINSIQDSIRIDELLAIIDSAFRDEDWQLVIESYEEIKLIDSSGGTFDRDEELFISYMNWIIYTANQIDVSVEDIDLAQGYYRDALSLFPQNREYASERAELQRVASDLIASKYYLYAQTLIQSDNFSAQAVREALRMLNIADSIGGGSPAVRLEIDRATLFINGFDNLVSGSLDLAIRDLENLYRVDSSYADGLVQYFLYEAYVARGDLLFSFSDYVNAKSDYESAETFAWGEYGNNMRLFEVETRLGATLRLLSLPEEAAEFYNFAFSLIDIESIVTDSENPSATETLNEALTAFSRRDYWNAARLFERVLEEVEIYEERVIEIPKGEYYIEYAEAFGSTMSAIREANQIGASNISKIDQEIVIPVLSGSGD
jgi:tetratricopeptide (TPR) repeat protein